MGSMVRFVFCFWLLCVSPALAEEGVFRVLERGDAENTLRIVNADTEEAGGFLVEVGSGDFAIGYVGRTVSARLVESFGRQRLEFLWPTGELQHRAMDGVNHGLRRAVTQLRRGESLNRGDYLPDFALFNQYGDLVFSRDLSGSPVVISFIFSRCGVDYMCPATTRRMVALAAQMQEAGLNEVRHLLISFDPAYDTPGTLRSYARAFAAEELPVEFLTGPADAIEPLMRLFGVRLVQEDGTIVHNAVALLVDSHRRIVLRQDGSNWGIESFLAEIRRLQAE